MRKLVLKVMVPLLVLASLPLFGTVDDSTWQKGPNDQWFVNWDKALAVAKKTGRPMLVLKTGSDWCYWCKKLHSEVLGTREFLDYAKDNLVLVYLDDPRRTPLGKNQQLHNKRVGKIVISARGVPHTSIVNVNGMLLDAVYGGGHDLNDYLGKIQGAVQKQGWSIARSETSKLLFSNGYADMAAHIDAKLAALPPASKDSYKVKLTGIATKVGKVFSPDAVGNELNFKDCGTSMDIPFGTSLVLRFEYSVPQGHTANLYAFAPQSAESGRDVSYLSIIGGAAGAAGKGCAYQSLFVDDFYGERFKAIAIRNLRFHIYPDAEFAAEDTAWDSSPCQVDLKFKDRKGNLPVELGNGLVDAPANDRKWQKGPDRLWFVNWTKALAEAKKTGKKLFVLNTGSDWCGWCKKLRADVLKSNKFKAYARKNLVLVYLDSPRQKALPADQQAHTQAVREKLEFGGGVPCVKIVDSDGENVLETIRGYRPEKEYLKALKDAVGSKK